MGRDVRHRRGRGARPGPQRPQPVRGRGRRRRAGPTSRPTGGSTTSTTRAPARPGEPIGAALAATFELAPGEARSIPFALAWDFPVAEFGSGRRWHRRHIRYFGTAGTAAWEIAAEGLARRTEWQAAIDAWQAPILANPQRPDWYKAALFNELYYLVDGGTLWAEREAGGERAGDIGPVRPARVLRLPLLQHARRLLLRLVRPRRPVARARQARDPGLRGHGGRGRPGGRPGLGNRRARRPQASPGRCPTMSAGRPAIRSSSSTTTTSRT